MKIKNNYLASYLLKIIFTLTFRYSNFIKVQDPSKFFSKEIMHIIKNFQNNPFLLYKIKTGKYQVKRGKCLFNKNYIFT